MPERSARFARYVLLEPLGSVRSSVHAAFDTRLRRRVALRLLDDDPRTLQAARLRARLVHPNAVAVHEVGVHEGQPFMATDLGMGTDLQQWLERRPASRAVVATAIQICEVLVAAHARGVVHGRLHRGRVVVDRSGRPTVFGFGLLGSAGPGAVDPRVDQYALCALLRNTVRRPSWLTEVLQRGMAEDPSLRFASMRQLVTALRRARRGAGLAIAATAAASALAVGATIVSAWPASADCGPAKGGFDHFAERWRHTRSVDCHVLHEPPPFGGPAGAAEAFPAAIEVRRQLAEALKHRQNGDVAAMTDAALEVARTAGESGWDAMVARAHVMIADARVRQGEETQGCALAHAAYEDARRLGDHLTAAEAATVLARCEAHDREAEALRWCRHADALLQRLDEGAAVPRMQLHQALAEIHEAHGRPDAAQAERAEEQRLRARLGPFAR